MMILLGLLVIMVGWIGAFIGGQPFVRFMDRLAFLAILILILLWMAGGGCD